MPLQAQGEHDDEDRHSQRMRAEAFMCQSQRNENSLPAYLLVTSLLLSVYPPLPPLPPLPRPLRYPQTATAKTASQHHRWNCNDQRAAGQGRSLQAARHRNRKGRGFQGGLRGASQGKKAREAAAEMSQLLDNYVPPPSNTVILDS